MPYSMTPEAYYSDSANHGSYQYVGLDEVLNNFMLNYVGDDKLINNVNRHTVLFHLRRGLQEFHYDILKEVKVIALEIGDDLTLTLPHDYVNYVRVSWLDANGNFRPILHNYDSALSTSYLQDNEFNILFDGDGYPLESETENVDYRLPENVVYQNRYYSYNCDRNYNKDYSLNTAKANVNGAFVIDKKRGLMHFSSDIEEKEVILEYISDGLEYEDSADIKVNKLAVNALYAFVSWSILDSKIGIQEYVVRRAMKKWTAAKRQAKTRLGGFRFNDLLQVLRGRDKWIK